MNLSNARKTHIVYHAGSSITACGRRAMGLRLTDERPTCVRCLRVWRDDRIDPHDPASSGAVR